MIPASSRFVVVGAGMHGLSTAYHLAVELRQRGLGSGADVIVLEKSTPGAGATGIACGVVRNNYFQPAMSELMQACVEVWESDPEAYHYNGVGYIALGPQVQESDLTAVYERHQRIGYRSDLYPRRGRGRRAHEGALPRLARAGRHGLPPRAPGRLRVQPRVGRRPARQVPRRGRRRSTPHTEVTGFELGADDSVTAVETDQGRIAVGEQVVDRARPVGQALLGACSGCPMTIDIHTPSGDVVRDQPMWTYWNLQEGEITVDPLMFATADGGAPPVIHLDTDAPLYTDDGQLVTDELWGIYYKRDRHGVQGGASPLTVDGDVELDPYPSTTNVDDSFPDMWCAALSHAMSRFEGCRALYKQARSGGVGSFTADNFPVFDYLKPNVYGDPRLEPRLQDDRRRPRGRAGAARRLGAAPDAVPLRALRDRRPAPGLELAVSLELAESLRSASGTRALPRRSPARGSGTTRPASRARSSRRSPRPAPARARREGRRRARARRPPRAGLPGSDREAARGRARRRRSRRGSRRSARRRRGRSRSRRARREHRRRGEVRVAGAVDRAVLDPARRRDPQHLGAVVVAVRDPDGRPGRAARGRAELEPLVRVDGRRGQRAVRASVRLEAADEAVGERRQAEPRGSDSSRKTFTPSFQSERWKWQPLPVRCVNGFGMNVATRPCCSASVCTM